MAAVNEDARPTLIRFRGVTVPLPPHIASTLLTRVPYTTSERDVYDITSDPNSPFEHCVPPVMERVLVFLARRPPTRQKAHEFDNEYAETLREKLEITELIHLLVAANYFRVEPMIRVLANVLKETLAAAEDVNMLLETLNARNEWTSEEWQAILAESALLWPIYRAPPRHVTHPVDAACAGELPSDDDEDYYASAHVTTEALIDADGTPMEPWTIIPHRAAEGAHAHAAVAAVAPTTSIVSITGSHESLAAHPEETDDEVEEREEPTPPYTDDEHEGSEELVPRDAGDLSDDASSQPPRYTRENMIPRLPLERVRSGEREATAQAPTNAPAEGGADEAAYRAVTVAAPVQSCLSFVFPEYCGPPMMLPNDVAPGCMEQGCKEEFGAVRRRHHCRLCGSIFCYKHIVRRVVVPLDEQAVSENGDPWQADPNKLTVLCHTCNHSLAPRKKFLEETKVIREAFEIAGLDIGLLLRASTVCKAWRDAAAQCLSRMRVLASARPTKALTPRQMAILWNNRYYWHGHAERLVLFARAVDWENAVYAEEAMSILRDNSQPLSCTHVVCFDLHCQPHLQPRHALALLDGVCRYPPLRAHAVNIMMNADVDEISCYLAQLVHSIRFDAAPDITPTEQNGRMRLAELLIEKAMLDQTLCVDLYWKLRMAARTGDIGLQRRYQMLHTRLISQYTVEHGGAATTELLRGEEMICTVEAFYGELKENLDEGKARLGPVLGRLCSEAAPLMLPVSPSWNVTQVDMAKLSVKKSNARPIVFPVVLSEELPPPAPAPSSSPPRAPAPALPEKPAATPRLNPMFATPSSTPRATPRTGSFSLTAALGLSPSEPAAQPPPSTLLPSAPPAPIYRREAVMFKPEDMRRDLLVLNVVRRMTSALTEPDAVEQLTLAGHGDWVPSESLVTYRILPTTERSGCLALVPRARTMNLEGQSLAEYMATHSGQTWNNLQTPFLRSLALWTVISYLLGVGDRHKDNIMITDEGLIFHIDFGHILGSNPTGQSFFRPWVRLDKEMSRALAGAECKKRFEQLCHIIFSVLRRRAGIYAEMLAYLSCMDPPSQDAYSLDGVDRHIMERFSCGLREEDALLLFAQRLEESARHMGDMIMDPLHNGAAYNMMQSVLSWGRQVGRVLGQVVVDTAQTVADTIKGKEAADQ